MSITLPEAFTERMKQQLGNAYEAWEKSYEEEAESGLRINRKKLSLEEWERVSPYGTVRVPWTDNGYYCQGERPAKDPYYYAGLYYLQEPSAMAPAAYLPIEPDDKVLDLCAAPGGKSTELGSRLGEDGFLWSNDISSSRARALLKNLELAGLAGICVTAEEPKKLADTLGVYFDKILVDAPCSGEGMFRKDPSLIRGWLSHGPEYYAPIQKEILTQAVRMLKPGGFLLYSTCTFARKEDEDVVRWLLETQPEMELSPLVPQHGMEAGLDGLSALRLFPHRLRGEGHFLALLKKKGTLVRDVHGAPVREPERLRAFEKESDFLEWEQGLAKPLERSRLMIRDDRLYLFPRGFDPGRSLRYLRTGLLVGEWKRKRFEPSQAAAMALSYQRQLSMRREDERVIRYLKGETISLTDGERLTPGWVCVCVDGHALGWARYSGGILKNKYCPGWRWQ